MSVIDFFKRRLVRLQPMVIMGMIIGAICFQDSVLWPTIHEVPIWKMLLVMVIGFTLIRPSVLDIRGWMHPLDLAGLYFMNILAIYFMHYLCGNFQNSTFNTSVSLRVVHLAVTSPTEM
jgi:hypothetical protein